MPDDRPTPPILYVNFVQIRSAFFDVTLTLNRVSEIIEDGDKKEAVVEQLARVQMSPQHAKALLLALNENLQGYERRFGEIRLPSPEDGSDEPGKN